MKTCEKCGVEFTPRHADRPGRFCSSACYHASGRALKTEVPKGQRLLYVPQHPLAPAAGTVAECRLVLYDKIGPGAHPCHWCEKPVMWMPGCGTVDGALVADHLNWDHHDNSPENLVPSCHICNSTRNESGRKNYIQPDELFVIATDGTRGRAIKRLCEQCSKEFLVRQTLVKRGQGRYCSVPCANRAMKKRTPPPS